jgi:hypothetical protein
VNSVQLSIDDICRIAQFRLAFEAHLVEWPAGIVVPVLVRVVDRVLSGQGPSVEPGCLNRGAASVTVVGLVGIAYAARYSVCRRGYECAAYCFVQRGPAVGRKGAREGFAVWGVFGKGGFCSGYCEEGE